MKICGSDRSNSYSFEYIMFLWRKLWGGGLRSYYRMLVLVLHLRPRIIVLGNQKSGTSAVASLVAECADLSRTIDIPEVIQEEPALHYEKVTMQEFVYRTPYHFGKELVKEPCLTFLYDKLYNCFPYASYVFVVRHPVDNIRSILDRVGIHPSELPLSSSMASYRVENPSWRRILNGDLLSIDTRDELSTILSHRWIEAAHVYLNNRSNFCLLKYEDFLKDKASCIRELCLNLGLSIKSGITEKVDHQFQPPGLHRDIQVTKLFSRSVLVGIEQLCQSEMRQFGYEPYSERHKALGFQSEPLLGDNS